MVTSELFRACEPPVLKSECKLLAEIKLQEWRAFNEI